MLQRYEECLFRGWLQGLPWATLAELYLDGASADAAYTALESVRRRFTQKARQLGRHDLVAIFRRERRTGEAWEAEMRRAMDAIIRLPNPVPTPASSVADWLPAAIAAPLQAFGADTLGAVAALIKDQGQNFWRAIPRFGWKSARALLTFFQGHETTFGLFTPIPPTKEPTLCKAPPTLAKRPGIAPFEQMLVPEHLDGRHGENRAPGRCRLDAAHDYAAISSWLNRWPTDSHTYRAYRKEAERFLLWSIIEQNKAFSSLNTDDCLAYRRFLADPTPADRWVGHLTSRAHCGWRPFQAGLSERSIKHAEGILISLCDWLVGRHYLDSNPFEGLPKFRTSARLRVDHAFSEEQWRWLFGYAQQRCQGNDKQTRRRYTRLLLILRFAYSTGLRLHEIAKAKLGHLEYQADDRQWWLHVEGKGGKLREVPLQETLWQELEASWLARGLPKNPAVAPPDTPLLVSLRREQVVATSVPTPAGRETALTPSGLHQTLKAFFREAGIALASINTTDGQRLQQASAHWLRHTHGSHAVRRGVPIEIVRDNLGHSSLATTSIYIHTERNLRYREMAKLNETARIGE